MNSLQIESFLAVADVLSFTKAAEVLYVSQSDISKRIKALEKELGFLLFTRNNKNVKLTKNGKEIRKFFRKVTNQWEEVYSKAKEVDNIEKHTIRIGLIEGWNINSYLNDEKIYPIKYNIELEKINFLLRKLVSHKYDVVIGIKKGIYQAMEQEKLTGVHVEKLMDIKRIIYYSKNHPLANIDNLEMKSFNDYTLYTGKSKVAFEVTSALCEKEGFVGKKETTANIETKNFMVNKGIGFAVGDELSLVCNSTDYKYSFINQNNEVGVAWLSDIDIDKKESIKKIMQLFQNRIDE